MASGSCFFAALGGISGDGDRPSTLLPSGRGPHCSPLPSLPSRAARKASFGPCLFLESVHWLGKEVSLVKRDLTVGHCEFEGLRRREEGPGPSICPSAGPQRSPAGGACTRTGGSQPGRKGSPSRGGAEALGGLPASSSALEGGLALGPREGAADSAGRVGVHCRPASCAQLTRGRPGRGACVGGSRRAGPGCPVAVETPLVCAPSSVFEGDGAGVPWPRSTPSVAGAGPLSASPGPLERRDPLAEGGGVPSGWPAPGRRVCATHVVCHSWSCLPGYRP